MWVARIQGVSPGGRLFEVHSKLNLTLNSRQKKTCPQNLKKVRF